ncbi:hypothetical protein BDZ89DRAFT_951488 [Hymenopellis radicata]|nr:hypothetical protein BDZ89DRAFT_951488 [Hymenopellis radicata]
MAQNGNVNPFAATSWLHLVLATCHPFNDGNGCTTRFIASIPLLQHGYPPISIPLDMRGRYFDAIHHASESLISFCACAHSQPYQAFNGTHELLMQCLFDGMQRTIRQVAEVTETEI